MCSLGTRHTPSGGGSRCYSTCLPDHPPLSHLYTPISLSLALSFSHSLSPSALSHSRYISPSRSFFLYIFLWCWLSTQVPFAYSCYTCLGQSNKFTAIFTPPQRHYVWSPDGMNGPPCLLQLVCPAEHRWAVWTSAKYPTPSLTPPCPPPFSLGALTD